MDHLPVWCSCWQECRTWGGNTQLQIDDGATSTSAAAAKASAATGQLTQQLTQ
jgi:hypothetical protein